jgi:gluconate kinase
VLVTLSGVNDTAVLCAAESVLWIIRKDIRQSWLHSIVNDTARMHSGVIDTVVKCTAVQYNCYRYDMYSSVIDTAVQYLREFEATFERALTRVSGDQGKLFDENKIQR